MHTHRVTHYSLLLASSMLLTGCANLGTFPDAPNTAPGHAIRGNVHGGQQVVQGSHVHLMAAASTGYGVAATSLLNSASTGFSDSIGAYVPTLADGSFSVTNDYTCTAGQVVYALATQGNPGLGVNNPAIALTTVLGVCPSAQNFATATPYLYINEVSTVATAYTLAAFMTDATHLSYNGAGQSLTGLTNAASLAPTLAPTATAAALATTPNGLATVPQAKINTLANILATCINSDGTTPCSNLFALAKNGTTTPTETATAILNIAHSPGANATGLYNLVGATANPFQPSLTGAPNDWALILSFALTPSGSQAGVAIDSSGDVWLPTSTKVNRLSPTGSVISSGSSSGAGTANSIAISPSNGSVWVAGDGVGVVNGFVDDSSAAWAGEEISVGFDRNGNAFVGNYRPASVGEISNGMPVNNTGYTSGGLTAGQAIGVLSVAVDSTGNVWSACLYCGVVAEMTSNGTAVSPTTGYKPSSISAPVSIAIDSSNNAWVSDGQTDLLTKFSSNGTVLSGSGYAAGGAQIAIDGNNNVWSASYYTGLIQLDNNGNQIGVYSAVSGNPHNVSIDLSGNAWVYDYFGNYLDVYLGIATPVVTPINPAKLGVRP